MPDLAGLRIGLLTSSASRLGGGVFEAVVAQAALIRSAGGKAPVFALDDRFAAQDANRFGPSPVGHLTVRGPAAIGFAPGLVDRLLAADLDCLHLHGIWMYPSRAAERWAARSGRPCVISPHGMLAQWINARGRIKKFAARIGYERRGWRRAAALHALTGAEAADIMRESGRAAIVIPNAAPAGPSSLGSPSPRGTPGPSLLTIGRIHPKKNLVALLEGWAALAPTLPPGLADARLTIAGWGEPAHVAEFRQAVAKAAAAMDHDRRVEFIGPVYGEDKARLLAGARFAVLPSHSEGLPIAVLEAWAAGVPTVMSAACNLDVGFTAGAAIESGTDAAAIAAALRTALTMPAPRWRAMAAAARRLAQGPFAPATIAEQWIAAYRSLTETRMGADG